MMFTRMASCLRIVCAALVFALIGISSPSPLAAADGMSSEVTYVELYARILRAVDSGSLDKSTGREARTLNASLQKKIIALDDRLKEIKTASMKAEGSRQDALLDELVALGAERERLYLDYGRRLEQVAGDRGIAAAVPTPPAGATRQQPKATENNDKAAAGSSQRTLTFENVPEDISTVQFD